jgi:hypothetical protein
VEDIENYDGDRLLSMPIEDLCAQFVRAYQIDPIELDEGHIEADAQETTIDTRRLPDGRVNYGEHQPTIPGSAYSFVVPFRGEGNLFRLQPSRSMSPAPRGTVNGSTLVLTFTVPVDDTARLKPEFDSQLGQIRWYLGVIKSSVDSFNNTQLPTAARRTVEGRRARLLKQRNVTASLGYPLRRREMPTTYAAPSVRRKIMPPPAPSVASFKPEPALGMDDYEHILSVTQNMAVVLERSPSAFTALGEEHLRWHFVVQLNGHYEGAATGETFNVEGKTDILVREGEKNIFIAECKFWHGPAGFQEAIDQLLGYASWRDTKTAIIIFNRDTAFTTVLAKIPEELRRHPNFKREIPQEGETRFRAILKSKNDPDRELIVTVLAFDVPR